jgi:hypothetical protein
MGNLNLILVSGGKKEYLINKETSKTCFFLNSGSYTDAFKNHQRRLQEEKLGRKSVINEYKTFAQNGGLGPAFLNTDQRTYEEKVCLKYISFFLVISFLLA